MSKNKKNKPSSEPVDTEYMKKISELEQKNLSLEDKLARSLADYANLEKRIESQRQIFITLTTTAIVTKMIEILDDLYLAQAHIKDQGLQMAIDRFKNVLKIEGLEEIEAKDKEFDPEFMDCVEVVEGDANRVIEVKKQGYKLNDHVIRPAQVSVGKQTEPSA